MSLRKQKGNMYDYVTHTWNPIKGKCEHDCSYCYMKKFKTLPPLRLDEGELTVNLGMENYIFVGSGTDMWAKNVPSAWIDRVMMVCEKFPDNIYFLQSKNPYRFMMHSLPRYCYLATTIESNRMWKKCKAQPVAVRAKAMKELDIIGWTTVVTIEPIMAFDLDEMVELIETCHPLWVNIGADSQGHKLPEPSRKEILRLIIRLKKFTNVRKKKNLDRILKKQEGGDEGSNTKRTD